MNHHYHKSNALLTDYVRTVLVIDGSASPCTTTLPAFTNGMPALLCKTETDKTGFENIIRVTLFGNSIPDDCWTMNNATTIIVCFFKPFALTSLFKVAARELAKNPIELCYWSPHKYNALKTQLIYAGAIAGKTAVLDNLLLQQHTENQDIYKIIHYATDRIMNDPATEILAEILKELKLTERTFQRIFKKYTGVTPTQYRRICQFQFSFEQLRSGQFEKISDVAFENGFSDQSHFIRSFKEFANITPNDYLQKGLTDKKH